MLSRTPVLGLFKVVWLWTIAHCCGALLIGECPNVNENRCKAMHTYQKSHTHTMARRIIGLAGFKGCGKDAVADHLVRKHGFVKYAFARPLKEFCQNLFLLSDAQIDGSAKETVDERYGLTPRRILQMFGTDFVRDKISNTFWVDRFGHWLARQDPGVPVVVCDVRFQNEVDTVRSLGGVVLLVDRGDAATDDDHVSEQPHALHRVDGVVRNDGTLGDLYDAADVAVRCL